MAGLLASRASRPSTYSGTPAASLRRRTRCEAASRLLTRLVPIGAMLAACLITGGCAVTGMFGDTKEPASSYAKADTTGSIPGAGSRMTTGLPPETDMVYAKAAISEVLTRGHKDVSTAWEN